jgi:starch phosphorylase
VILFEPKQRNFHRTTEIANIKIRFLQNLRYQVAKDEFLATPKDMLNSLAKTVWEPLVENWLDTHQTYNHDNVRRVYYLSLEFLMGRSLINTITNMKKIGEYQQALEELGYDLEDFREQEEDAGLGNGGLGRLAACFLDSLATMQLPAYGYGIRYDYGIFRQEISNGYQIEHPDNWLRYGNPWEIGRPEALYHIHFYGNTEEEYDDKGKIKVKWVNTQSVLAMAYDTPIPGYGNNTVNTLRLWSAKATREFNLESFNKANYVGAVRDQVESENISKVLYPNDLEYLGKELRLKQQYFFSSASLQDALRRFRKNNSDIRTLPDKVIFQLNDTHPSIAIVELLRLLIDEEGLEWTEAWAIITRTFAYTNHTLMPEALEKWPVELMTKLLPRHMQLIYEINRRFLIELSAKFPNDPAKQRQLSIIEEGDHKNIRMAHLAIVGSSRINGVARLHSDLLIEKMFPDFYTLYPEKFTNVTNGITQRRWLLKSNPALSELISAHIGPEWITNLDKLKDLKTLAKDKAFQTKWRDIKTGNKQRFAAYLRKTQGIDINPNTMFDFQVKRMHEYKRQLLNALHCIHLYNEIKANPKGNFIPRTVMFGGKSAPGYFLAKLVIKLVNAIGDIVNNDPEVKPYLNVFFLENYRVSLAEWIFPAAELSEQISTAGTEASGTGNMKFALNGALTIGTLDGANVEIQEEVGKDNIFIFGLKVDEVNKLKAKGYNPKSYYEKSPSLKKVIDMIKNNYFSKNEPGIFDPIIRSLLEEGDQYLVLADYDSYVKAQKKVEKTYANAARWNEMSILNVASIGKFSSDRSIADYNNNIWHLDEVPIQKQ